MEVAGYGYFGGHALFAADIEVHPATISYILNDKRTPGLLTTARIVKVLNESIPVENVITIEDLIEADAK